MPRLDRLPQISRNNLLTFLAQVNDTAPFVRPARPLAAGRLAIVTTLGLHVRRDPPFRPGGQTHRVIPSDARTAADGPRRYYMRCARPPVAQDSKYRIRMV